MATIDLAQYKYSLILDSSQYDAGMKKAESAAEGMKEKLSNVGSAIQSGFEFGAKAAATAVTAATGAITALVGAATKGYASYEQLVGGVETLFGTGGANIEEYADSVGQSVEDVKDKYDSMMNAQQTVFDNASKAYQTAGLSANEYMDTVTSFSASLIASLGGDTQKAAEYSNRAITDMADNANKMGTNIESIQNAYQGFAKQNYTMLDNLKLGYGGTKEEMQRLIQDASQMTDVQEKLGITVDSSTLSFGNIVNAISVMQEKMGIAGTTAKEAATTIEGSVNMTKAAWSNLVTGIADDNADFKTLVDNFVDSAETAASNLIPRIEVAINGVGVLIDDLLPVIMDRIPQIITNILPKLVSSGANVVTSIGQGIISNFPILTSYAVELISQFVQGLHDNFPHIIDSGGQIIQTLVEGLAQLAPVVIESGKSMIEDLISGFVNGIPEELPKILDFIQSFADLLAEKAPEVIQWGFDMLSQLVDGIISALPIMIEKLPEIITTFANIINDNFPVILQKGVELLWQLLTGILSCIPDIIENIPQIVEAIVSVIEAFQWLELGSKIINFFKDGIMSMIGAVGEAGTSVFNSIHDAVLNLPEKLHDIGSNGLSGMIDGLKSWFGSLGDAASNIYDIIVDEITGLPGRMYDIGSNIVSGIWEGISDMWGWMASKIGGFADKVTDKIKSAFGIHSPSRVMRDEVGNYLAEGIGVGFEDEMKNVNKSMQNMLNTEFKLVPEMPDVSSVARATTSYIPQTQTNQSNNQSVSIDKIEITLPNVTNYAKFKTQLMKDNSVTKFFSEKILGQALGHNELTALKYI